MRVVEINRSSSHDKLNPYMLESSCFHNASSNMNELECVGPSAWSQTKDCEWLQVSFQGTYRKTSINPLLPNGGASGAPPLCFSQISFIAFGILLRAFMYS